MVHTEYARGLFTAALAYTDAVRGGAPTEEIAEHERKLLAASRRDSARKLRDTGEAGGVPDGALLLEQLADEAEHPLLTERTTKDIATR